MTPDGTERLTYLLRPNVTRPDFRATMSLDTPPTTDIDHASLLDESDFATSESEVASDSDVDAPQSARVIEVPSLPPISESRPTSPAISEEWSPIGGSDLDGDESDVGDPSNISASIDSLSVLDPDSTPQANRATTQGRPTVWVPGVRSAHSSPSRSPSRRAPFRRRVRRAAKKAASRQPGRQGRPTFYDYVFSPL